MNDKNELKITFSKYLDKESRIKLSDSELNNCTEIILTFFNLLMNADQEINKTKFSNQLNNY